MGSMLWRCTPTLPRPTAAPFPCLTKSTTWGVSRWVLFRAPLSDDGRRVSHCGGLRARRQPVAAERFGTPKERKARSKTVRGLSGLPEKGQHQCVLCAAETTPAPGPGPDPETFLRIEIEGRTASIYCWPSSGLSSSRRATTLNTETDQETEPFHDARCVPGRANTGSHGASHLSDRCARPGAVPGALHGREMAQQADLRPVR